MTRKRSEINISDFEADYLPQEGIFREDSEFVHHIKKMIAEHLTEPERRLLLYYAESMSLRKVAKKLGVSLSTANNEVKRVKEKIKCFI